MSNNHRRLNSIFLKNNKTELQFGISEVHGHKIINIFSDASMSSKQFPNGVHQYGCFGSIVVREDDILETYYRIDNMCTTNICELASLRLSLSYAIRYAPYAEKINIFSDSLYSIDSIRKYIYGYRYQPIENTCYGNLLKGNGNVIDNQSLIVECIELLDYCRSINPNVRIFHQSGHVNYTSITDISKAANNFKKHNNLPHSIDLNVIRYLSYYNDYIDHTTRSCLYRTEKYDEYSYPVEFYPTHGY